MTKKTEKNRITQLFEKLKAEKKKGFIAFITAGDPDIGTTKKIIRELEHSGADMIELGIPFSDPMADGPTIQASYERAVKGGVHLTDVLKLVEDVRKESPIPLVLFGYYNPIFNFGLKKFAKAAAQAGADGVLIVDLPPEESDELKSELVKNGVDLIFLL
ncbi:MAG: tryptophan synthase subunit alpha, partial [Deltaproteobacteria bacterium]|nr:tryptophan synthase subunit alpha [Deltaproteobacteria bacterium]